MARETIDYGIDLGTTNSSIALWGSDGQVEVIKNSGQAHGTPSAVAIDSKNRTQVGLRAKNLAKTNPDNVHVEFKQRMGRDATFLFPESGRSMSPEELSAEVLKSLKADVRRRFNEDLRASVITIPAAFDKMEIAATNRAAQLSGFAASPLCLEPAAAALAYGHKSASEDGFWLVFDFGGGTFDSAVVQLVDEEFRIVNHRGHNQLGGKLIDYAVLDHLLLPKVAEEFDLDDFTRENRDPSVRRAIAKLKLAVEDAKVMLSVDDDAEILVDLDPLVPGGQFDYELTRGELSRMAEPFVVRAINICKDVLADKRLSPQDIERLILVGGPTQMPVFRDMLADPRAGLGIPLEYSVDPMTVVAQGAAIFARTQRLPDEEVFRQGQADTLRLELRYEPAGPDDAPDVAGKLSMAGGDDLSGYTIEFAKSDWRSGRIPIGADGTFLAELHADVGENAYTVEVQDGVGQVRKTTPERMSYLRKSVFTEVPLLGTISVARADNSTDVFFEKGMTLPVRGARDYVQTTPVSKGAGTGAIRIPIVEGFNARADRNILIGYLTIGASEIKRDVPAGSAVEFSLSVDASNVMTASAYIPVLDQDFEEVLGKSKPEVDTQRLRKDAEDELDRTRSLERQIEDVQDERAAAAMQRVVDEDIAGQLRSALELLAGGGDAPDVVLTLLRDLRIELDKVETQLEWPRLVDEARTSKRDLEELMEMSNHVERDDHDERARLNREFEHAVDAHEPDLLRRVKSEFDDLYRDILQRNPANWAGWFDDLRAQRAEMADQGLVDRLIAQGQRSIDTGDVDGLKSAVTQMVRQLNPEDLPPQLAGFSSTIQ